MDTENSRLAALAIAESLCDCMVDVRKRHPTLDRIYGACLTVPDDFSSLFLFFNTQSHLDTRSPRTKWDVYSWWSDGLDIDDSPLRELIGEVNDIDEKPEDDHGPTWLAALTIAMHEAKSRGAFHTNGQPPYVFCTMTDSANSHWLQYLSAQYLNDDLLFAETAGEVAAANYAPQEGPLASGRFEYRLAYGDALARLRNAK